MMLGMVPMTGRDLRRLKGDGVPADRWMPGYQLVGRVVTETGRKDAFWFAPTWLAWAARLYLYFKHTGFEADVARLLFWLHVLTDPTPQGSCYLVVWTRVEDAARPRWFWERA